MRTVMSSAIALLGLIAVVYAVQATRQNQQLEQQLQDNKERLAQMLQQVEENTLRRLDDEKQIDALRNELLLANSRSTTLGEQLEAVRQQVDPDFAAMEEQIRSRVTREVQRQLQSDQDQPSSASLISQLSALSMEERVALMAVQAQYGGFLDSLNVDRQRKEVIAEALMNLTREQNQARIDLASQQLPPQEIRRQMAAINNPAAVQESLAYALTEAEIAQLLAWQQANPTNVAFGATGAAGGPVFMMRAERGGRGTAIQRGDAGPDTGAAFDFIQGDGAVILQQRIDPSPN